MTTGRNQACPCGSGRKYKYCCEGKSQLSKNMIALIVAIAVLLSVGLFASFSSRSNSNAPAGNTPIGRANRPQPPGPAPAGKVWSVEHGHWHDAAPGQAGGQQTAAVPGRPPQTTTSAPVPQPPGAPPPGKVWSPEHGHWHDAPK